MTLLPVAVVGRRGLLVAGADGAELVVDVGTGQHYSVVRLTGCRTSAAGVVRGTGRCTSCGIAMLLPVEDEPSLLPCGCQVAWAVADTVPTASPGWAS